MKLPTPRASAAMPRLLLLCLASVGILQAVAQSNSGFISIDCGLPGRTNYVDNYTRLSYTTDAEFIDDDAGSNHNITVQNDTPTTMPKSWYSVRSFPNSSRNCYTFGSLEPGLKYLIRGEFLYGNYDGLNQLPVFNIYLGVNFWSTVNISKSYGAVSAEVIVVVPDDSVQVCLINTGGGTPFISGLLDLRPLKNTLYPMANETQALVCRHRYNLGPTDTSATGIIRYPDDRYDRIWSPYVDLAYQRTWWDEISTDKKVKVRYGGDLFEAPSAVMQTAVTPRGRNASENILAFRFDLPSLPSYLWLGYIYVLHLAELQQLPSGELRQLYVNELDVSIGRLLPIQHQVQSGVPFQRIRPLAFALEWPQQRLHPLPQRHR